MGRTAGQMMAGIAAATFAAAISCAAPEPQPSQRTFATPEEAARALVDVVKAGDKGELLRMFGRDGEELAGSSDPATARQNREVFTVAATEGWALTNEGPERRTLVIGNEQWPFPIPLVKDATVWRFDTAAGKEEVLSRRIGRNELAVIQICRTYVFAQKVYARRSHDGRPAGLFAKSFRSDAGRHNGLYWPADGLEKHSPLGDLMAQAEKEGRAPGAGDAQPSPFHGYYFRILTAQGPHADGGEKNFIVNGEMSAGFGLVAWPAQYNATGVMTFIVNQAGIVHESDLGPETDASARAIARYDPDSSWRPVQ